MGLKKAGGVVADADVHLTKVILKSAMRVENKIAFVKMEYFLYAFADAHRLMRQLDRCGQAIRTQVAEAEGLQL